MRRRAVTVLMAAVLAALAGGASACLSPTLPLPPPEDPDTMHPAAHDPDVWTIGGTCTPGAIVEVFNTNAGVGVSAEDRGRTGRYSLEVRATRCDIATVKQVVDDETSAENDFVIQETDVGGVADAGACK